jgi:hypothetical protein
MAIPRPKIVGAISSLVIVAKTTNNKQVISYQKVKFTGLELPH